MIFSQAVNNRVIILLKCLLHSTDRIVFSSRVLTFCDFNVLHADFFAIVGRRRARKGQQHHVDGTNVGLTGTGSDSRFVMVPNLITVEVREKQERVEK